MEEEEEEEEEYTNPYDMFVYGLGLLTLKSHFLDDCTDC